MEAHRITAAIAVAAVLAACGSGTAVDETTTESPGDSVQTAATSTTPATSPSPAPTTTDGVLVEIEPPTPPVERVVWAVEIVDVVNGFQAERALAAEQFNDGWQPGEAGYEAQRDLYESDVETLRSALDLLPPPPVDEVANTQFLAYVDAAKVVLADAQRIAGALTDREDELRTTERTPQGLSPEIDAILDGHRELVETWRSTCFDLQTVLTELHVDPLDCVGTGDRGRDPLPVGFDPADVTVTIDCVRGDSLDELPFDRSLYDFLTTRSDDTNWIRTAVTIKNSSDERILVDPNFLVRWFTADDDTIVTTEWMEPFAPSLSAMPGQTAIRTGYSFEGNLVIAARDDLPAELIEQVYNTAEGCEIVGTPAISVIDAAEFIDPDFAEFVEQTECRPDDTTGRWRIGYRVTNSGDVPIRVNISAELVDGNGDRRGTGGGGEETLIAPGTTVESAGWSVYYTIDDVRAVERCVLLSLQID